MRLFQFQFFLFPLFAPVTALKGLGARFGRLVEKAAGQHVVDLIWHVPTGLIDRRFAPKLAEAVPGNIVTLTVMVEAHQPPSSSRLPYRVRCSDDTSAIELVFFHAHADYLIGTMIEIPRACFQADQIARDADFFSFGTNDLTQTALGFSRDDIEARVLARYIDVKILGTGDDATGLLPGSEPLHHTTVGALALGVKKTLVSPSDLGGLGISALERAARGDTYRQCASQSSHIDADLRDINDTLQAIKNKMH